MLCTEETVRGNVRNWEGQRVYFLREGDRLTPGARDFLTRERIRILPASEAPIDEYHLLGGGVLKEKPEQMTHLHGNVLVYKTHPRIAFRGAMDTLEAELLWCQTLAFPNELQEILDLARHLIRCEVLNEPVKWQRLCGMTEAELRRRSHHPEEFYSQPHFMPAHTDGQAVLALNRCRCAVRAAELAAAHAFIDDDGQCTRTDILQALNRMSSTVYLLMIQAKSRK